MVAMEYEDILEITGGFGRFQILMFICLGLPTLKFAFNFIFHYLSIYKVNFRCAETDNPISNVRLLNDTASRAVHFAMSASSNIMHMQVIAIPMRYLRNGAVYHML